LNSYERESAVFFSDIVYIYNITCVAFMHASSIYIYTIFYHPGTV